MSTPNVHISDADFRRGRFRKMPFSNYNELNTVATELLRQAVMHERACHWSKTVQCYRRLVQMISRENFPPTYVPKAGYGMLLYEVHFHLGWALQQLGEDRKAAKQYTKSLLAIGQPKNGCTAGCYAHSCLMTPVHARRAFAYARMGDHRNANNDAESGVVLDNANPDVFCIRALVKSTQGKEKEALRDLNHALKLNKNHLCALLLRGKLDKEEEKNRYIPNGEVKKKNTDHEQAIKINPDCRHFLDVMTFNHPRITEFFHRFLFALNIPHIVTNIDVTPEEGYTHTSVSTGYVSPMKFLQQQAGCKSSTRPFRCGTTAFTDYDTDTAHRRRNEYGDVIRQFILQPRTPEQTLEKLKHDLRMSAMRSVSQASGKTTRMSVRSGRASEMELSRSSSTVPVFQPINVKDAPRMYYRPWAGDRMPVADVKRPRSQPIFR